MPEGLALHGSHGAWDITNNADEHASDIDAAVLLRHLAAPSAAGNIMRDTGAAWASVAAASYMPVAPIAQGDVLVADAAPAWARYALVVPGANIHNYFGVTNGEITPTWKSASSNPGTAAAILASDANGKLQLVGMGVSRAPSTVTALAVATDTSFAGTSQNMISAIGTFPAAATVGMNALTLQPTTPAAGNYAGIAGVNATVNVATTGSMTNEYGVIFTATASGATAALTNQFGVYAACGLAGATSTCDTTSILYSKLTKTNGIITTLRGLALADWTNTSGSVTTSYGIYADTSIDVGTTKYFVYSLSVSPSIVAGTWASKQAAAAGIGLDHNSATGNFTLWLSPANLTANRRVTFGDADLTFTGGGTLALTAGQTYTFGTTGGTIPTSAGTLTVSTANGISAAGVITHAITSVSSSTAAANLLSCDASGLLQLLGLGLGVAAGTSRLKVSLDSASALNMAQFSFNAYALAGSSVAANITISTQNAGASAGAFYGVLCQAYDSNNQNVDTLVGGSFTAAHNSGGGIVAYAYGGLFRAGTNVAGGTTTTAYAGYFDISKPAGTITNAYGVYVTAITEGATLNYAVYTAGLGLNRLGDQLAIVGGADRQQLTVTGYTTQATATALVGFTRNDTTAGISAMLDLTALGSGANLDGGSILLNGKTSTTAAQAMGLDQWLWVDATHASRKARRVFNVYDTAVREGFRIEASGAAPMIGFLGAAAVVRPTALTTQLTTITHTAPGTPDYAIQDFAQNGGAGIWGFVDHDEANTVLSVIANLQTRMAELEDRLGHTAGFGLLTH